MDMIIIIICISDREASERTQESMLQTNPLKQKMAAGQNVLGLLNSVPSPWLVEMIGYAGYDFVILDMEHLAVNPETVESLVRAAECAGLIPLIRVPACVPDVITRALDTGALGVVVPRVNSPEQARQVVRASRYHPLGERGITGGRTTGFGTLDLGSYMERANREILVVLMIEDREGVERIDEILAVPGIDWVLEGALDMSQSYGVPGDAQHPDVQAALQRIATACQRHGVAFCALPRLPEQAAQWRQEGVRAMLLGEDRGLLFRQLKAHRQQILSSIGA